MGVIKYFSSSSNDNCNCNRRAFYDGNSSIDDIRNKILPNPDPDNYEIIKSKQIDKNLIVMVHYFDCENYEGNKIIVYKDCTIKSLMEQKTIDPHFSDNQKFHNPFARFEPTDKGWEVAEMIAHNI